MGRLQWIPCNLKDTPSVISIQKSDVLKCIDDLTDIIYETIPIVGPIATSYNISALLSIFSVVQRREPIGTAGSDSFTELSGFDKSKEADKRKEIDRIISESYDAAGKIVGVESPKDLQSAIAALRDKKPELDSLTPKSGDTISPLTQFMKDQRNSLHKQQQQLEATLNSQIDSNKDYGKTAQRVELYLLTCAWLFVYDKAVVHLLGFQARSHLISGETAKYVSCMMDWDKEFSAARRNVYTTAYFLNNKDDKDQKLDGLLVKLHAARTHKDFVQEIQKKISDPWPPTAFGFFRNDPEIKLSLVTDLTQFDSLPDAKKVALNLYKASHFRFFDLSVQSIVRVTENWKDCLAKWNRQCPLSPPKYGEDGKVIKYIDASPVPGTTTGYKGPARLCYAVSYVTSRGEGAVSDWTEPHTLQDNQNYNVTVTVQGVKQLYDPLAGYEPADTDTRTGNTGKGTETIRRVYVQYTPKEGQSKVSRVCDMKPQDTGFMDKGFEAHLL